MMRGERDRPKVFAEGQESDDLQETGRALIASLVKCLKLTQLFDRHNQSIVNPLRELRQAVESVARLDDHWELALKRDYLYLCDERLKISVETFTNYHFLMDEFRTRSLGSFTVQGEAGIALLTDFLYAFGEAGKGEGGGEQAFTSLQSRLREAGAETVVIEPLQESDLHRGVDPRDIKRRSIDTFFKAIYFTRGVLQKVKRDRVVPVRLAKRLVASLVDILSLDEATLLGLTNIKNYDEYTFNHSVNVCVLSLAVGRRLGLSRRQLGDLGLAALFHDLGKVGLPPALLNKLGGLSEEDFGTLRKHPVDGVKQLARLKGLSNVTTKLMNSVFRHHNNFDGSGYPPLRRNEEIDLYPRIIRIVDSYDAMTSKRIYRRNHLNNIEAIEELWNLAGEHYDPSILKVFIATIGIFPVGSLVQLSSGEISIVLRNAYGIEDLLRPQVKTLALWSGESHTSRVVDLGAEREIEIVGYFRGTEAEEILTDQLL